MLEAQDYTGRWVKVSLLDYALLWGMGLPVRGAAWWQKPLIWVTWFFYGKGSSLRDKGSSSAGRGCYRDLGARGLRGFDGVYGQWTDYPAKCNRTK